MEGKVKFLKYCCSQGPINGGNSEYQVRCKWDNLVGGKWIFMNTRLSYGPCQFDMFPNLCTSFYYCHHCKCWWWVSVMTTSDSQLPPAKCLELQCTWFSILLAFEPTVVSHQLLRSLMEFSITPFIHSFIQVTFMEGLLLIRWCAKCWGYEDGRTITCVPSAHCDVGGVK